MIWHLFTSKAICNRLNRPGDYCLQENDSKISRAERKAKEEVVLRQQKEKEIQELQATLDSLRQECEQVLEVVQKNIKYQRYLETVLEVADEHQEIGELLNRHTTLGLTNEDLKQQQKANSESMEQIRSEMNVFVKSKTDEILNTNNKIARLKKELERLRMETSDQEAIKDLALQVTSQNTLAYGQVRTNAALCGVPRYQSVAGWLE